MVTHKFDGRREPCLNVELSVTDHKIMLNMLKFILFCLAAVSLLVYVTSLDVFQPVFLYRVLQDNIRADCVYTQQPHIPSNACVHTHTHTQSYSNTRAPRGVGNRWSGWTRQWWCKQCPHRHVSGSFLTLADSNVRNVAAVNECCSQLCHCIYIMK